MAGGAELALKLRGGRAREAEWEAILGTAFLLPFEALNGLAVFVAAVGAWGLTTSQVHKWAHNPRPPRLVRWLQRAGLILRPEHHHRHHRAPFTSHYCITTGWCNPLLERIQFWRALEWVVSCLTGLKARDDLGMKQAAATADEKV